MYITSEGVKSEQAVREDSAKITIQATGATSWRRADVKYRKNEAFVDVVENVNLLMSSKGEQSGQLLVATGHSDAALDPWANRNRLESGRRWTNPDASILDRYARMQVWPQRQACP